MYTPSESDGKDAHYVIAVSYISNIRINTEWSIKDLLDNLFNNIS